MASELEVGSLKAGASSTQTTISNAGTLTVNANSGAGALVVSNADGSADIVNVESGKFVIDSSGNVGVSQTDPQQKLHVSGGGIQVDGNISTPASGQEGLMLDHYQDGSRFWSRGTATARGSFSFIQLENDGGSQQTALSIDSTGLATFTGGINLGNETLSVYRKGTFAPGLYYQNGSGVTIGGTAYASHGDSDYIKQVGQYVKVGNVVHVQIYLEAAIAGSIPNDNLGVQGLPFTSQNVTDDRCLLNAYTNGGGSVNHAVVTANNTVAVFETINGTGNLADDVGTGSNVRIFISGTYITA